MACTYPTACYTSLPPKSLNTGISLTPILILSVAVLLSAAAPPSCRECYQSFHYRGKIQQSFTYHTHIERSCYGTLIEECAESGKSYYKVKNLGVSGSRNGVICPQGKQWLLHQNWTMGSKHSSTRGHKERTDYSQSQSLKTNNSP